MNLGEDPEVHAARMHARHERLERIRQYDDAVAVASELFYRAFVKVRAGGGSISETDFSSFVDQFIRLVQDYSESSVALAVPNEDGQSVAVEMVDVSQAVATRQSPVMQIDGPLRFSVGASEPTTKELRDAKHAAVRVRYALVTAASDDTTQEVRDGLLDVFRSMRSDDRSELGFEVQISDRDRVFVGLDLVMEAVERSV